MKSTKVLMLIVAVIVMMVATAGLTVLALGNSERQCNKDDYYTQTELAYEQVSFIMDEYNYHEVPIFDILNDMDSLIKEAKQFKVGKCVEDANIHFMDSLQHTRNAFVLRSNGAATTEIEAEFWAAISSYREYAVLRDQ